MSDIQNILQNLEVLDRLRQSYENELCLCKDVELALMIQSNLNHVERLIERNQIERNEIEMKEYNKRKEKGTI